MKIVIEIDDDDYQFIKDTEFENYAVTKHLYEAVYEGTPLPKGHGRLGDLDALEKEIVNGIKAGNYEEGYDNYAHINNMDDCVDCVRYADAIIEADKGEEE